MIHLIPDNTIIKYLPELNSEERDEVNEGITQLIQEYCNTTFEEVSRDEKYDSKTELVPRFRPIISVTSLIDDGALLVEDRDFFVYEDKIYLESASCKRKAVRIQYSSGFVEVPQTVKEVAVELFRFKVFTATEGSLLFYKSQKIEERSYERDPYLDEETILDKLRAWVQPVATELKRGDGNFRVGVI